MIIDKILDECQSLNQKDDEVEGEDLQKLVNKYVRDKLKDPNKFWPKKIKKINKKWLFNRNANFKWIFYRKNDKNKT